MPDAVMLLLGGVLGVAVLGIALRWMAQVRRTNALARAAHELGLRFSADDPFDIPRRYAALAVVSAGHSPQAHSVSYGRVDGCPVRAFDFRFEVAHAARRATCRYGVVVMEAEPPTGDVLVWNAGDHDLVPLEAQAPASPTPEAAQAAREALADLARHNASLQAVGNVLMLCLPLRRRHDYAEYLPAAIEALKRFRAQAAGERA